MTGLAGMIAHLIDGNRHFLDGGSHPRGGFALCGGGRGRSLGGSRHFNGRAGQIVGAALRGTDHGAQTVLHQRECSQQAPGFITSTGGNRTVELTVGDRLSHAHRLVDGMGDRARQPPGVDPEAEKAAQTHQSQNDQIGAEIALLFLEKGFRGLCLIDRQGIKRLSDRLAFIQCGGEQGPGYFRSVIFRLDALEQGAHPLNPRRALAGEIGCKALFLLAQVGCHIFVPERVDLGATAFEIGEILTQWLAVRAGQGGTGVALQDQQDFLLVGGAQFGQAKEINQRYSSILIN